MRQGRLRGAPGPGGRVWPLRVAGPFPHCAGGRCAFPRFSIWSSKPGCARAGGSSQGGSRPVIQATDTPWQKVNILLSGPLWGGRRGGGCGSFLGGRFRIPAARVPVAPSVGFCEPGGHGGPAHGAGTPACEARRVPVLAGVRHGEGRTHNTRAPPLPGTSQLCAT